MATIMASACRGACILAGVLLWANAEAVTDDPMAGSYNPLPAGYSLSFDKNQWNDEFSVFNMAVSDPLGVMGSGFATSNDPRLRPLTRLDSAWTATAPLLGLPMRLGDGVSSVGFWEQPARLGGIQIGTYRPTAPAVVEPPTLIALPYDIVGPVGINSNRFIDHLTTMVQVQQQSLVAPGQTDFSFESGRVRENFEMRSSDYGPWLISGTYRYGISPATTLDSQIAQLAGQQSLVGVGLLERLGEAGQVSARLASSRDNEASGWLARMGYDFSRDGFSLALRSHIQSAGFQDVGDTAVIEPLRQRTLARAGLDLGGLGKISLASATQTYIDDSRRDIVAVSHAMPFGSGGIVSTAAAYSPGQLGNSAVLLSFSYPFDYFAATPRQLTGTLDSALDRTIVDAFGQTRSTAGRLPVDPRCPGSLAQGCP